MKENAKFRGILLDENDKPIPDSEFTGWNSRSMAVTVIFTDTTHRYFVIEKRGPGCPDNIGKYCMPCGYLNWDETLAEAAARELYEETGLKADPDDLRMYGINDSVAENRQNVTVRFVYDKLTKDEIKKLFNDGIINCNTKYRGGENSECSAILFVSIDNINAYKFAFGHDKLIKSVAASGSDVINKNNNLNF